VIPPQDLVPGVALPDYHVRARNLFRDHPNRIHDDAVARRHGFAGGLVAGTTVYAYLTHPLVARLGPAWLAAGTAHVRFRRPVYEGDLVRVRARVVGRSGDGVAGEIGLEVVAATPREEAAALMMAGLAWGAPPVTPDPARYPEAALPASPPPASDPVLATMNPLGSPGLVLEADLAAGYLADHGESLDCYRGPGAVAHPGLLLQQANRALSENVRLGPWAHVTSDIGYTGLARVGERVSTRGRVARVWAQDGRGHVELDLLVIADGIRPVMHVRHHALYDLGPRAAA
jgi:acyl dehydratase